MSKFKIPKNNSKQFQITSRKQKMYWFIFWSQITVGSTYRHRPSNTFWLLFFRTSSVLPSTRLVSIWSRFVAGIYATPSGSSLSKLFCSSAKTWRWWEGFLIRSFNGQIWDFRFWYKNVSMQCAKTLGSIKQLHTNRCCRCYYRAVCWNKAKLNRLDLQ